MCSCFCSVWIHVSDACELCTSFLWMSIEWFWVSVSCDIRVFYVQFLVVLPIFPYLVVSISKWDRIQVVLSAFTFDSSIITLFSYKFVFNSNWMRLCDIQYVAAGWHERHPTKPFQYWLRKILISIYGRVMRFRTEPDRKLDFSFHCIAFNLNFLGAPLCPQLLIWSVRFVFHNSHRVECFCYFCRLRPDYLQMSKLNCSTKKSGWFTSPNGNPKRARIVLFAGGANNDCLWNYEEKKY